MDWEDSQAITEKLDKLSVEVSKQHQSLGRMFVIGIVYGIGFFVGSAIIATILLGILGPLAGQVPWIHDAFETGLSLLKH
jgi:hypothetical protein